MKELSQKPRFVEPKALVNGPSYRASKSIEAFIEAAIEEPNPS